MAGLRRVIAPSGAKIARFRCLASFCARTCSHPRCARPVKPRRATQRQECRVVACSPKTGCRLCPRTPPVRKRVRKPDGAVIMIDAQNRDHPDGPGFGGGTIWGASRSYGLGCRWKNRRYRSLAGIATPRLTFPIVVQPTPEAFSHGTEANERVTAVHLIAHQVLFPTTARFGPDATSRKRCNVPHRPTPCQHPRGARSRRQAHVAI